jgi:fatty acid-binding protein DegV
MFEPFNTKNIEFIGIIKTALIDDSMIKWIKQKLSNEFNLDISKIICSELPNVIVVHTWDDAFGIGIAMKNERNIKK